MTEALHKRTPDIPRIQSAADAQAAGMLTFKFFTDKDKALKAQTGADGRRRVVMTASTSVRDLVGDTFTQHALEQMRDMAPGTTIFLNHSSQVPYDVFGAVEKADLVIRQVEGSDNQSYPIICLEYVVLVDSTTDQAQKTYAQIENGIVTLGASVTVAVLDKKPQAQGRGSIIDDIYYLECSVVGIPANPLSFVQYARKALNKEARLALTNAHEASPAGITLAEVLQKTSGVDPVGDTEDEAVEVNVADQNKQEGAGAPAKEVVQTVDAEISASADAPPTAQAPEVSASTGVTAADAQPAPDATAVASAAAAGESPIPPTATVEKWLKPEIVEAEKAVTVTPEMLSEEAVKGLFVDAQKRRVPSPYELFDVISTIVYRLARLRDANRAAGVSDDFDYRGSLTVAVTEFAAALYDSFLHQLSLDDADEIASYAATLMTTLRAVAVLRKDAGDGDDSMDEEAVSKMVQLVHDCAMKMGADCGNKESGLAAHEAQQDPAAVAEDVVKKSPVYLALETELKRAESDRDEWKAGALAAKEALKQMCEEPLGRAGASQASA